MPDIEALKETENIQPFILGEWYVDPESGRISHGEQHVKLEPRVMDVLTYLSARQGQVVSREDLEASVWAGMVVGYEALTSTMQKLRKALGDDSKHPNYIETVSKRGYRLIAGVHAPKTDNNVGAKQGSPDTSVTGRGRQMTAILFVTMIIIIGVLGWFILTDNPEKPDPDSDAAVPVAVLPFENISGDPEQKYYADGITSDLITELSTIPELAVISKDSTSLYKDDTLEHIRRELGVHYVLKGNVRRDDTQIRINAQLIDTKNGRHLWAKRFDATLEDTFSVQDEITKQIAGVLEVHFNTNQGSMLDRYFPSIEAYDLFLRGLDHYGRRSFDDLAQAKSYYQQAIDLDPKFARAYANLGLIHLRHAIDGWEVNTQGSLDKAKSLAQEALQLNDQLAEIHFVNAFVDLFRHEYENAIRSLDRALDLRPSYADAYAMLAWVLQFSGRPEQAEPNLKRAIQLNPHTPASYLLVQGEREFLVGRYSDAIMTLEYALEKNPIGPRTLIVLAAAYAQAGRIVDANWIVDQLLADHPTVTRTRLRDAFPYKDDSHLQQLLDGLRKAGVPE